MRKKSDLKSEPLVSVIMNGKKLYMQSKKEELQTQKNIIKLEVFN